MKRTKLSLAAIVAMGTFSYADVESAKVSLEEALKDVKVSGFVRSKYNVKERDSKTTEDLRLSAALNGFYTFNDSLLFGATLAADGHNKPSSEASAPIGSYNPASNKGLYVDRFYFKYTIEALSITGGKQDVTTPWTETGFNSSRGNGLSALFNGVENWTFAGVTFFQTNGFDDSTYNYSNLATLDPAIFPYGDLSSHHNFYALGAVGAFKDIGLGVEVWGSSYEKVIDTALYADVQYTFKGFKVRAQANYAKLDKEFANRYAVGDDDGFYYGAELGYTADNGLWIKGCYNKNDKDQPIYILDGDNLGFIKCGSDLYYTANNRPNAAAYSIEGGKRFEKLRLNAGYGYLDDKVIEMNEYYAGVAYRLSNFNAKLSASHTEKTNTKYANSATLELVGWF